VVRGSGRTGGAMSELKACPFCRVTKGIKIIQLDRSNWEVFCENCRSGQSYFASKSTAMEWWNTRPIEDALRKERDELREMVDEMADIMQSVKNMTYLNPGFYLHRHLDENICMGDELTFEIILGRVDKALKANNALKGGE
jgi:hypothetical protein